MTTGPTGRPASASPARRRLAWALTPSLVVAAFTLVAGFDALGYEAARDATYVAVGVLVPVSLALSFRALGEALVTSLMAALLVAGLAGTVAALPVAVTLNMLGQDFGFAAVFVSALAWLGLLVLTALVLEVVRLVTGGRGDPPSARAPL